MLKPNGAAELTAFTEKSYKETITPIVPGIWHVLGVGHSNAVIIEGRTSVILVDTLDTLERGQKLLEIIRSRTEKPVKTILYTHGHPDHRGGAEVFLKGRRDIPVWGHADFGDEQRAGRGLEQVSAERAARQFGAGIPDADYPVNVMLPRFAGGKSGPLLSPNIFVTEDRMPVRIDGVNLELHRIPGESTDHLVIWLPERQVLFPVITSTAASPISIRYAAAFTGMWSSGPKLCAA